MATKQCQKCGKIKSLDDFHRNRRQADGRSNWCKSCHSAYKRDYYQDHKAHLDALAGEYVKANAESVRTYRKAWNRNVYMNSPRKSLGSKLRMALIRRPTENPVTLDELCAMYEAQGGRCALTGIMMTRLIGRQPTSISLDRIEARGFYTKDNVRLICDAINRFKGENTDAEMLDLAEALLRQNRPDVIWPQEKRLTEEEQEELAAARIVLMPEASASVH